MIEIPLDAEHPVRHALASAGRAFGKPAADALEERIRMMGANLEGKEIKVLNLSKSPEQEMDVLEQLSRGGSITHVCTKAARYVTQEKLEGIYYSETFDAQFWEVIALGTEPDLLLSDGSLSDLHQIAMLKLLFPAIASGGTVVLQQPLEANTTGSSGNALVSFLNELISIQMRRDKQRIEAADAFGYLLRNVDAVTFSARSVAIRKRHTAQRRLKAVPFADVASDHRLLDAPTVYKRITARIYGSDRISKKHQKVVEEYADVVAPPAEIGSVKNAVVTGGGIVHTSEGFIIQESFINARHTSRRGPFFRIGESDFYVSERPLEPVRTIAATSLLMKQTWDANYGHWIVDTLPRMHHYAEHVNLKEVRVIVNGSLSIELQQMQAAGLALFGVRDDQLLPVDWQATLAEELVYVTPSSIPPFIKSPYSIEILESLVSRLDAETIEKFKGWERIYLTRNAYSRRRLVNEDEIVTLVEAAGYRVVVPESLTFNEQIALFSQATHVMGNMGAGFSNLAFSPYGVKVLMLATEHMAHDYFYDLACHKNGQYLALQGTAVPPGSASGIGADFLIDREAFRSIFTEFDAAC